LCGYTQGENALKNTLKKQILWLINMLS